MPLSIRNACALAAALAVLSGVPLHAAVSATPADTTFAAKVSLGGMYEVEASKLAESRATAQDVKDLANTEVHDHTLVNSRLKQVATAARVPIAAQLNGEFAERLAKLKAVSGPGFDAAYISDMQQIHDKDEKLFAQEATQGSGNFKPFASEADAIVKRHIGALNAK